MAKYTHIFTECGNGFPEDGSLVVQIDDSGNIILLEVIESSPIHTAPVGTGRGNFIYLVCSPTVADQDIETDEERAELFENSFQVEPIDEEAGDE